MGGRYPIGHKWRNENLIGQIFGKWKVLSFVRNNYHKHPIFLCRCVCGKEKEVFKHALVYGRSKSCGCSIHLKEPGEANLTVFYYRYKHQALQRKIPFLLSKNAFRGLVTLPCSYCGKEPTRRVSERKNGTFIGNGIDRINSDLGYTPENCIPCCKECNYAKHVLTQQEFRNHIIRIYNYWAKN